MLIDSHCHLATYVQQGKLELILNNAEAAGVNELITIGTSIEDWNLYQGLAKRFPEKISYTVGLHPSDVTEDWEEQVMQVASFFAEKPCPVAIGEIGLDYFRLPKFPDEAADVKRNQLNAFRQQLSIALQLDCPVIIHSRHAFHECLQEIDASKINWDKVLFHCFTEGAEQIRLINSRGGRGSFTGIITYKKAEEVREAALEQGLEKMMIETDAPYLAPVPFRGKENEPAFLQYTADFCARLFGLGKEDFAERTRNNTRSFFNLH